MEDPLVSTSPDHAGPAAAHAKAPQPADADADARAEIVIRPRSGWIGIDWKEIWAFRELFWFLVWRDVTARYKQTILGGAWAVIQPMMLMLTYTVIFGRLAKLPSQGLPYAVFVFAALVPWAMFSQGMPQAALSMVNQQQLLTKVYFPRIFIPTAAAAVYVVDLVISLGLYAGILFYYQIAPSWTIVFLPALVLLTLIATLGFSYPLSAFMVFYRDFRHAIPFLTQLLLFFSFVIYPGTEIKNDLYRWLLSLNPMFGLIMGYRSAILGLDWDLPCLAISTASALGGAFLGAWYFRQTERRFADFI